MLLLAPRACNPLETVSFDVNVAAMSGRGNDSAAVVSPTSGLLTAQTGEPVRVEATRERQEANDKMLRNAE